jgi:hypothetical protein
MTQPIGLHLGHRDAGQLSEVSAQQHVARLDPLNRSPGHCGDVSGMLSKRPFRGTFDQRAAPSFVPLAWVNGQKRNQRCPREPVIPECGRVNLGEDVTGQQLHAENGNHSPRDTSQPLTD